jgi:hypothetical protein
MSSPSMLPAPATPERIRRLSMDSLHLRALESLYLRRDAVDDLIRSLEEYEDVSLPRRGGVLPISVGRKCWSDCAQSQT